MLVPGESTLNGTGEIVEKHGSESYVALVWRRLKRSWTGMAGLLMVILLWAQVGYAMVLRMMGVKYLMPFFFLGFLAGGYLDLSLLAFGGVGVIMALLYIQLNPQWRKAEPHPQTTTITALDQLDD